MTSGFPLAEELTPAPDPWAVARQLAHLPHPVFFDSAGGPPGLAGYSYVAADPPRWLCARGTAGEDPFDLLKSELVAWPAAAAPGLPPFQGGAAGLFGYDLCHWLERLPRPPHDEFQPPDFAVGVYDRVISWDHRQNRAWVVSTGYPETDEPRRLQRAAARLREFLGERARAAAFSSRLNTDAALDIRRSSFPVPGRSNVVSNFDRAGYVAAVRRAVEYINAGDCFQVNVSQRLLAPLAGSPLDLYGRLRERNPAPFAGYFDLGSFQIASASPERFLHVSPAGEVETRPIKGTRPRGRTPDEDRRLAAELLASAKDRAENVMIVDLMRNDLGRVCEFGSVAVHDLCRLESYPTVHHLVSEVRGRLRRGLTAVDLLAAAFPGGSVTGAPKVRAMEIIAELEPTARGPYCGSLGWLGFDGAMDTNILIRTFTAGRGWVQFPVGGGVVADSDPQREYEETLHKAAGLLRALE
jgi:para-aminobenzoate synthetase component 1